MTRLGLTLRYVAWWIAIAVAALLWRMLSDAAAIAQHSRDSIASWAGMEVLINDWPAFNPANWDVVYWLALAAILPTLALPCASAIFSDRRPRLAMQLAIATILLSPALYAGVVLQAPYWPLWTDIGN
ncbi:hypothetical protein [Dongia sp. agr-C8]